jgi:hypothetical protein
MVHKNVTVMLMDHWLEPCVRPLVVSVCVYLVSVEGDVMSAAQEPLLSHPVDAQLAHVTLWDQLVTSVNLKAVHVSVFQM